MDFQYSDQPEPHKERTKQILKAHPEVRNLIGRNPVSAVNNNFCCCVAVCNCLPAC